MKFMLIPAYHRFKLEQS